MCEKTYCPYCGNKLADAEPREITHILHSEQSTTWEEITRRIKAGEARQMFCIGDEIHETLTTGEDVVFVVSGIDVYKPNEVIFTLKDCLAEERPMNEACTNSGGWVACDLRKVLNSEIFESLPLSLQRAIIPRRFSPDNIVEVYDPLWLLSEVEVFGDEDWAEKELDRGVQLPYYARKGNRVKGLGKDGSATSWWERSPRASNTTHFCTVNSTGGASYNGASYSWGVCFGFCI